MAHQVHPTAKCGACDLRLSRPAGALDAGGRVGAAGGISPPTFPLVPAVCWSTWRGAGRRRAQGWNRMHPACPCHREGRAGTQMATPRPARPPWDRSSWATTLQLLHLDHFHHAPGPSLREGAPSGGFLGYRPSLACPPRLRKAPVRGRESP